MKRLLTITLCILSTACATGIGKKISDTTMDEIRAAKGKITKSEVRKKIGAAPMTQLEREGLLCDAYSYSGSTNYILFSIPDKTQSYNFCYDNADKLQKVDGLQM